MSLWLRRQVTANYWINLKGLDKSNSTITKMFDDLWERVKEEKTVLVGETSGSEHLQPHCNKYKGIRCSRQVKTFNYDYKRIIFKK